MFDYIISNPPYSINLHLDIVEYVYRFAEDVVNISPDYCYTDILRSMNTKYQYSCQEHLYSLDHLTLEEQLTYFAITVRIGIQHYRQDFHSSKTYIEHYDLKKRILEICKKDSILDHQEGKYLLNIAQLHRI